MSFLFNAELESDISRTFNERPLSAVFGSLLSAPRKTERFMSCRHGLFLLRNLAYRTTGASIKADKYESTSLRTEADMDLYAALVVDFVDATTTGFSTLDPATLPLAIGQHQIYVISLPEIDEAVALQMDDASNALESFIGAVEIDLGNPLMYRVLVESLPEDYFFIGGSLGIRSPTDPDGKWDLSTGGWWRQLSFSSVFWWDAWLDETPDDYVGPDPIRFHQSDLSARGEVSNRLLDASTKKSHTELVLDALAGDARSRPPEFNVPTTITTSWEGDLEALVDAMERKFTEYLLDDKHPVGRDKARVFKAALGFDRGSWRLLARQLVVALTNAEPEKVRSEQHAVKYEFDAIVVGPNDREVPVRAAWRLAGDGTPLLVTAWVLEDRDDRPTSLASARTYVVRDRSGPDFWRRLHAAADAAARSALDRHIPPPMFLATHAATEGVAAIPEGEMG